MTVYLVRFTYQGDRYSGGQYDSKADANTRVTELSEQGFPGAWVQPTEHAHNRYCGHNS